MSHSDLSLVLLAAVEAACDNPGVKRLLIYDPTADLFDVLRPEHEAECAAFFASQAMILVCPLSNEDLRAWANSATPDAIASELRRRVVAEDYDPWHTILMDFAPAVAAAPNSGKED